MEIKLWGKALSVFTSADVHVSVAQAFSGGKSSTHKHNEFDNIISVVSGQLRISLEGTRKYLSRGDSIRIPAGVLHSFFAEDDSVFVEVYVRPGDTGGEVFRDIERLSTSPA